MLSVKSVRDMSGGVREPCHGNGSTEHCAAVYHHFFLCVKLGGIATTTHGKLQQALGDVAMSRSQAFRLHKMFSKSRKFV